MYCNHIFNISASKMYCITFARLEKSITILQLRVQSMLVFTYEDPARCFFLVPSAKSRHCTAFIFYKHMINDYTNLL